MNRELIYRDGLTQDAHFSDVDILLLPGNEYSRCTFDRCRFIDGTFAPGITYRVTNCFINDCYDMLTLGEYNDSKIKGVEPKLTRDKAIFIVEVFKGSIEDSTFSFDMPIRKEEEQPEYDDDLNFYDIDILTGRPRY